MNHDVTRHDWTASEIIALYETPLPDLLFRAQAVHRAHHRATEIQLATLLSVKTGGCPENCGYCPQSAHHNTGLPRDNLMDIPAVLEAANQAKALGATRFCMGAAWREVKDGPEFDRVLEMVRGVRQLGLEACCTLGMLTAAQAARLAEAGLDYYNHNLDTSPEFYGHIISTRVFDDRLQTLEHVRGAGIHLCTGGIIGMGESVADRCRMLGQLASMRPHPESVPINALVAVKGTPLEDQPPPDIFAMVRMIATARILMPNAMVRLSAGREFMTPEGQFLCLLAGANSLFYGEKLLTTPNPSAHADRDLLERTGMRPMAAHGTGLAGPQPPP